MPPTLPVSKHVRSLTNLTAFSEVEDIADADGVFKGFCQGCSDDPERCGITGDLSARGLEKKIYATLEELKFNPLPLPGLKRLIALLRTWATLFADIEPRIAAYLERDHALRAPDRGLPGSELIERTTGGIRWLPEVGIRRVILAPTYFSRPYNILLAGPDWRFFAYPVADEALEPDDRLAPPPAVVRLHRALGDDTRLRILKLL